MLGTICRFVCVLTFALIASAGEPAMAEKRIAMVVGVDRYANLANHLQLKKAVNDARSVSSTLGALGFEVVTAENGSRIEFIRAWQGFLNRNEKGDVVALFFAGHGVEIDGQNFLLPSDVPTVQAGEEEILKAASINFDGLLVEMQRRGGRLNLIILDACRDNPFATAGGRSLGGSRGLARVQPASGTFVMYSAGLGQSALDRMSDDDRNPNSVYTRELLPLLAKPGLTLLQIATRVRRRVRERTLDINHLQVPAYYDEVIHDFYLAGRDPGAQTPQTDDQTQVVTLPAAAKGNDSLACQRAILEDTLQSYEKFLQRYPNSECAARIQSLFAAKVEKIQWDKARSADSIAAYREYLIAYAGGIYASHAKQRLAALSSTGSRTNVTSVDPSRSYEPLQNLGGYDIYGGDFRHIKRVSQQQCLQACESRPRCRAYTYNWVHRLCFLKEAVGTLMPNHEAVSAARASDMRNKRRSNVRIFQNSDILGADYRKLAGVEFLSCYKACEVDKRCGSIAYVQRTAVCWLKTASGPTRRKKGVVLGIKE